MNQELINRIAEYIIDNGNGCSDWSGPKDKDGYPLFYVKEENQTRRACRVLWQAAYGPIPDGLVVRHECDNPPCLVLDHLILGTHKQNTQDAIKRGRMTGPRKVTPAIEAEINRLRETRPISIIAATLGISIRSVYAYLDRRHIRHGNYPSGPDHWNYRGTQ